MRDELFSMLASITAITERTKTSIVPLPLLHPIEIWNEFGHLGLSGCSNQVMQYETSGI